jgi:hypothetical protein
MISNKIITNKAIDNKIVLLPKIKKIIDNIYIKLFKIYTNNEIFYSLYIKKIINNNLMYNLEKYNIKDIEIECNFDTLDLSYLTKIEYITCHGEIKELYVSNLGNIKISGLIPSNIIKK